jgi:purine nucleosidase/pyrimidine-specific ribonucleoside hydrolase
MPPTRVLLDTDPGIDDALSILLALASPELHVEAITTSGGNLPVEKTTVNALKIVELAGAIQIPVAKGVEKPLFRKRPDDPFSHGEDGLGNTFLPEPKLKLDPRNAVDVIVEKVKEFPGELTLITTGPLTNIGLSLMKEPWIAKKIREHILMGGIYGVTPYGYQNATGLSPVLDWNICVDPEAAKVVFHSGMEITTIGNDVTTVPSSDVKEHHITNLEKVDTPITRFAAKAMRYITQRGFIMHLHDPMAVAIAVRRDLFKFTRLRVDVETQGELTAGQTIADHRMRRPVVWGEEVPEVTVATDVDGPKLIDFFIERIQSMKK